MEKSTIIIIGNSTDATTIRDIIRECISDSDSTILVTPASTAGTIDDRIDRPTFAGILKEIEEKQGLAPEPKKGKRDKPWLNKFGNMFR